MKKLLQKKVLTEKHAALGCVMAFCAAITSELLALVCFEEGTRISNILLGVMMLCVVLFVVFTQRLLPDAEKGEAPKNECSKG